MSTAIAIAKEYASLIDLLETSDELTPEMIADTLEGMEGELGDKLDVFPAPAGINREAERGSNAEHRVPRASGDKPALSIIGSQTLECSPRQRG